MSQWHDWIRSNGDCEVAFCRPGKATNRPLKPRSGSVGLLATPRRWRWTRGNMDRLGLDMTQAGPRRKG